MGTLEQEVDLGETVLDTSETGAETRPDERFTPAEVVERVTNYFSVPRDSLIGSEPKSRLAEIRGLTLALLTDQAGQTLKEAAAFLEHDYGNASTRRRRTRARMGHADTWAGFYRELSRRQPPRLPLLDQYVAGFCKEFWLTPDMLRTPPSKGFLYGPRDGLIYRLVTETPVPLDAIRDAFGLEKANSHNRIIEQTESRMADDEGHRERIIGVPRSVELPPDAEDPDAIIKRVRYETGVSKEDFGDSGNLRTRVVEARHLAIRRLYYRTALGIQEISNYVCLAPDHISAIATTEGRPESETSLPPKRLAKRESKRLSRFFGLSVERQQRYEGDPHYIFLFRLKQLGLSHREITESTGVGEMGIIEAHRSISERMEQDPLFGAMVDAALDADEFPDEDGLVGSIRSVCAMISGAETTDAVYVKTEKETLMRDWVCYFLRKRAGLRSQMVQHLTGIKTAITVRRSVERIEREVAASSEMMEAERFLWQSALGRHVPREIGDPVLYFLEQAPGRREAVVGKVVAVEKTEEGSLLIIENQGLHPLHHSYKGDSTVMDAESAKVIMRDPDLLDFWFFGHRTDERTQGEIRDALDQFRRAAAS